MRGPIVGRKQVAAILYSLIETAKLVGIDPKAYLRAATLAALTGQPVPLPHELRDSVAAAPTT